MLTRRMFVAGAAGAGFALLGRSHGMSIHLSCGALGIKASQTEAIDYAARYGFDVVDADGGYLGNLSPADLARLLDSMKAKNVGWAMAGFPTEFRKDDAAFSESIKTLPAYAAGLERAGVKRVTTWISPNSADLTYMQNLRTHARRLREAAGILNDQSIRFGMEYVGPKTSWSTKRYPFVHTMAEMKELIAEIDRPNVGLVLDSWHWYTSGETKKDLLTLRGDQVVSVDLNDAPTGIPVDQQMDGKRELPAATGVIDAGSFLGALQAIGYDGPVRAEPFNDAVRKMAPAEALVAAKAAIDKAFAQIG
ncbi:MAG: sugar phosphate isomerase/epimerase family protein [Candidatus Solibacter sp.]